MRSPWPEHGELTVEISLLEHASSSVVVIGYESMDLTATGGTDYVALDGTITITAGDSFGTFQIPFIDDLVEEGNEEYVVKLNPPAGVEIGVDYIHATIIDEESIRISLGDASIDESSGDVLVPVYWSDSVFWPVQIRVETSDGTAVAPGDYEGKVEVAQLPNPPHPYSYMEFSSRHVINDDALDEPDETFTVTISGHQYVNTDGDTGTVTILDDDDPPSVSIADDSGLEDSVGELSFAVTLDAPSGQEVTLDYATADVDATMGVDYEHKDSGLTFIPGETEKTVEVTVHPDDVREPDEKFNVTLQNPINVTLADRVAVGTIIDDDAELSIADAAASEADGELAFLVTADGLKKPSQTVTVAYATADDDATEPSDYGSTMGTLTFTSTDTERTITVAVVDDMVDESDEKLFVNLTNATNATIGDGQAEGTIRDNDVTSAEIELTAAPDRVREDAGATPVVVTAMLDAGARTEATTVTISVAGSGNADAVDFADVEDFTITISAGETSGTGTFTLTPDDDDVDEQDEILSVEGTSVLPVTGDTVELADDDQPSAAIELSARPSRIAEDGGAKAVRVRATLDASARTEATTVTVAVAGTGNADAVDFEPVPSFTITIAAGDKRGTGTFTLTPTDDEVDESNEMLSVTGTSVLPVTGTEVELEDDDATSSSIALTAQPPRLSEGDGATPVGVTATLDADARTEATTVTISVAGSGNADAVDFADVEDFTITISAGETSGRGTFTLTPDDDDVDEQDEILSVEGTSVLPVTGDTVELADDDQPSAAIELSARPSRIAEDGGARAVRVRATLDASARTEATTVTVAVAGTGNADAVDFEPVPSFTITIAAGDKRGTGTFTLTPTDDEVDESNEMLSVTGTSVLPVTGTEVELEDDDATSSSIALTAQPPRLSEGDGATPVGVTASLDAGARTEATTVTISVAGSGNADAVDFADVEDFTITISAGETSGRGTFTLTPDDDDVDEQDEMLSVEGTSVLPVTGDTVELADDDQPSAAIELSARPNRIAEDGGARAIRVRATLDASARTEATTVTVAVAGTGNADAVDFEPVPSFTITIAAGDKRGTGTFTLTPTDDEVDESHEMLSVTGTSVLPVTGTEVELEDDDATSSSIALTAQPPRLSEGDGATPVGVTATLDAGARTEATTVTISVAGSGNADAVDFADVEDFTITISAGETSGRGTFTLTPDDDDVDEQDEMLSVEGTSVLPVTGDTVELADDDQPSAAIELSARPNRIAEDGGARAIRVTSDAGCQCPDGGDHGDGGRGGNGERRRRGLRARALVHHHHRRGRQTRHRDLHAHPDGRRSGRVARDAVGDRNIGPAGDGNRGRTRGRRRDVVEHRPDGTTAPVVGRRRRDAGRGDGDARCRCPDRGDDRDDLGGGKRECRRGGFRRRRGLHHHDLGGGDERHGNVHADAGRRRRRRTGRDAVG